MKIKYTYIVYSPEHKKLVKLHECCHPDNTGLKFYIETDSTRLDQISIDEGWELIQPYR